MLNVAAINGRLVANPELRHTATDIPVVSFTLAVDRGYVKEGTERQADFLDIVAWRSTAEFVSKYFTKGQLVGVEGSLQTRVYTDSQGNKRKATEIVASKVDFAESKRDRTESNQTNNSNTANFNNSNDFATIETDDDLPF